MKMKGVLIACFLLLGVAALAGLFPKLLKEVPGELHGKYVLLVKMNPDKTKEIFTNRPPFVTVFSNQITFAAGTTQSVERVMRIARKGTNVYVLHFEDQSSWIVTRGASSDRLVVLEPTRTNSRRATTLVIRRELTERKQADTPVDRGQTPDTAEPVER